MKNPLTQKKQTKLREAELEFKLNAILEMRFGDGTGQDLQVKLARKEILSLFSAKDKELVEIKPLKLSKLAKNATVYASDIKTLGKKVNEIIDVLSLLKGERKE